MEPNGRTTLSLHRHWCHDEVVICRTGPCWGLHAKEDQKANCRMTLGWTWLNLVELGWTWLNLAPDDAQIINDNYIILHIITVCPDDSRWRHTVASVQTFGSRIAARAQVKLSPLLPAWRAKNRHVDEGWLKKGLAPKHSNRTTIKDHQELLI